VNEPLSSAQSKFLGIAVTMLVLAVAAIRVVTVSIKQRLGPGSGSGGTPFAQRHAEGASPELLKEALSRGLVTPSQLATMSDEERQFVLASLRNTLRGERRG
jgi:hypothetical protein